MQRHRDHRPTPGAYSAESRSLPVPAPADERLRAPDPRLGLFATVALVVGGIVGTGIFTVPAAIADYGWLSVPAFAVVGGGSLALALTFARLVRRTRRSGGP
jgi:APA family basic amino acid/polyamine antiporter